jgi:hypothetical protein
MTTSERVVEILVKEGGYRELPRPFNIGTLSFDFTYALVAGNKSNDLVVVIELKGDSVDDALVRKVMALTRALDVLKSRRSLTTVLTSGQARPETLYAMGKVCRVLPIGSPSGPEARSAVRDWLSVLLPLSTPPTLETHLNWQRDLREGVPDSVKLDPMFEDVIKSAPEGQAEVERVLADRIAAVVDEVLEESEEDE